MILKKGTYRFNDVVDTSEMDSAVGELNFVSNGEAYYQIILSYYQNNTGVSYQPVDNYDTIIVYSNGWNIGYQTVLFSEDQNVDDEFGTWFIANTNYNQINAPITFNITENTEFTLATKGKYCDKDIAVNVAVPVPEVTTEEKTVTPTKSIQTVTPTNADYLSKVTVNAIPSDYITPTGTKSITNNGTHDVTSYASVSVNVADIPAVVGTKEITENGVYDAIDDGLEGYSSVTVNVPVDSFEATVRDTETVTVSKTITTAETVLYTATSGIEAVQMSGSRGSVGTMPSAEVYVGDELVFNGSVENSTITYFDVLPIMENQSITIKKTGGSDYTGSFTIKTVKIDAKAVDSPPIITVSSEDDLPTDATDGTIAVVEASGEESVSITLKGGGNNGMYIDGCMTYIKFGSQPTSNSDYDYKADYTRPNILIHKDDTYTSNSKTLSLTVAPIAYVWTDNTNGSMTYLYLNGQPYLWELAVGYSNAKEVSLNNGDSLVIYSIDYD